MSAKLNSARTGETAAPRYTLIRSVRFLNPTKRTNEICDILLKQEVGEPIPTVEAIGNDLKPPAEPMLTIQSAGLFACRSFVDLHTHTCDPGNIALEDIRTAGEAAAAGGYGDALVIPHAPSPWSDGETLDYLRSNYSSNGSIDFHSAFYLTEKNQGLALADLDALFAAGVSIFYEEGNAPLHLLYEGMKKIAALGGLLILRCNLPALCPGGNPLSKDAAIAAETVPLAAAIAMAEAIGCRLHITLVSTAPAVEQIRAAKARGAKITCDTAPQYFTYDDRELLFQGGPVKVDPPLRKAADKRAIIGGLADGTIDCIVSDHTPVAEKEKNCRIADAIPGMLGLQTAFGLALRELRAPKEDGTPMLDLYRIVELFTTAPAKILGLPETVEVSAPAKLVLLDLQRNYTFTAKLIKSKTKNCPWVEQQFSGRAKYNFAKIQKDPPKKAKIGRP